MTKIITDLSIRLTFFVLILLLHSCEGKFSDNFDYSRLESSEKEIILNHIDSLQSVNTFFKIIIDELEALQTPIIFSINADVDIAGFVPDKKTGNAYMYFENIDRVNNESVLIEEFFHAFQYSFYGKSSMIKNENNEIVGAPNYEYEAKLLKAIINITLNNPAAETPSQKGLLDFVLSMTDDNGNVTLVKLNEYQQKQYISLVKYFQQHWNQRNINEMKNSLYDDPIIEDLEPKACLYIVEKYNTKNKKGN